MISEIPASALNSLVSLETLNVSYNVLRTISFLASFSTDKTSLTQFLFHGNEVSNLQTTIKILNSVTTLAEITIAENPITDGGLAIFRAVPHLKEQVTNLIYFLKNDSIYAFCR